MPSTQEDRSLEPPYGSCGKGCVLSHQRFPYILVIHLAAASS
jgi:hypothetical protein